MSLKTILLFLSVILLLWACQRDEVTPDDFTTTQQVLDATTLVFRQSDIDITGAPFGNRQQDSTRFLIRDIYSNIPVGGPLQAGSIITIRAYKKTAKGRGALKLTDVMVKHGSGYNRRGGNFEYMRIKYDATTDYTLHPNGLLPTLNLINSRGKDLVINPESCVSCHRKARQDSFIFSRIF